MADDVENLTLRVLQELRGEIGVLRDRVETRFGEVDQRLTDLVQRIDGNTLVFNLVAGVVHDHENRLSDLEQHGG